MSDVPLKLCPICASIAERRNRYDWGKVGCSNWECPIISIAFYPERWNERPLDKAIDAANIRMKEALEKLARLGNGSEYGNSDGNMIARQALNPNDSMEE